MTSVVLAVLATPSSATSLTNALFVKKDLDSDCDYPKRGTCYTVATQDLQTEIVSYHQEVT